MGWKIGNCEVRRNSNRSRHSGLFGDWRKVKELPAIPVAIDDRGYGLMVKYERLKPPIRREAQTVSRYGDRRFALKEVVLLIDKRPFLLHPLKCDKRSRICVRETHHLCLYITIKIIRWGLFPNLIPSETDNLACRSQVPAAGYTNGCFLIGIHFSPGGGSALTGQNPGYIPVTRLSLSALRNGCDGFVQQDNERR